MNRALYLYQGPMLDAPLSQSEFAAPLRSRRPILVTLGKWTLRPMDTAWLFGGRVGGALVATTVGIATLFGLLVFAVQPASAADTKCIENPTAQCVAEIAAQRARRLDRSTRWEEILGLLAVAGRTDVAEELSSRLPKVSWPSKDWLQEKIIALRIAATARANASHVGTLDALSALDSDPERISRTLYFVFMDMAGEQPYTRGGTPWLVDAEKAYASRHRAACNATTQAVLQRWSDIVDAAPPHSHTSARLNLANAYSLCREIEAARRVLDKIDPNQLVRTSDSLNLTMLVRSWIRAERLDRAMAGAAIQPNLKWKVEDYLRIASADVSGARNINALKVASEASVALAQVKQISEQVKLRASLIDLERQAGNSSGALAQTEELALLADRPDPFRPFSLIQVATLFNDLSQPVRAIEILERAIGAIPSKDKIIAFGQIAGPIRYERSGLEGEAFQSVAEQLYRAGDRAKAGEIARQADPLFRHRVAIEVVRDQLTTSRIDPIAIAREFKSENPGELLLVAAGRRIELGDIPGAAEYFQRFAKSPMQHPDQVYGEAVRVAMMLQKPEYLSLALQLGLRAAARTRDPERRVVLLSSMAAFANARLP